MIGLAFILGFATCYLATGALMLAFGWRAEWPASGEQMRTDILCALLWPCAFLLDDDWS